MSDLTTFCAAVADGDETAVREGLALDPNLASGRHESGVSVVMWALYNRRAAVAELLAEHRSDLDLLEATALGRADEVNRRLAAGADLVERSPDGFTALHYAAFFGHPVLVHRLLEAGAPPDAVAANPMMVQPLHSAASAGSVEGVRALLDAGVSVDARQQAGFTALHAAAVQGNVELGQLLVSRGADPSLTNDAGQTAMDLAQESGHDAFRAVLTP